MDIAYPGFGRIVVDGAVYEYDIVIEHGQIRPRDKGPSRRYKGLHGHTPLTSHEEIPWSTSRLIIGSGYSGRLPVDEEVHEMAVAKGVVVEVMPTTEACSLISDLEASRVTAILHVTC